MKNKLTLEGGVNKNDILDVLNACDLKKGKKLRGSNQNCIIPDSAMDDANTEDIYNKDRLTVFRGKFNVQSSSQGNQPEDSKCASSKLNDSASDKPEKNKSQETPDNSVVEGGSNKSKFDFGKTPETLIKNYEDEEEKAKTDDYKLKSVDLI